MSERIARTVLSGFKNAVSAMILTFLLLLPEAYLVFSGVISLQNAQWLVPGALLTGSLISGLMCGRKKHHGLVGSLVCGLFMGGLLLVLSCLVFPEEQRAFFSPIYCAIATIGNCTAVFISGRKQK